MPGPVPGVPHVPLTMRRAAGLVRDHRPASMTAEDAARLVETLERDYALRVTTAIRSAMASSADPAEQVVAIARVLEDLGLGAS